MGWWWPAAEVVAWTGAVRAWDLLKEVTIIFITTTIVWPQVPGGSDGKASAYSVRDPGSIPGLGRSLGEGNGNPLQYSSLENPMDSGAW